tara:strand:+ start:235 stop:444 length:210 start_codon:yes stop_codon:yes gene_type:complete
MTIDEEKNAMKVSLAIVSQMSVEDFQTELENHKIESNTIDNYIFDLAKALSESNKHYYLSNSKHIKILD